MLDDNISAKGTQTLVIEPEAVILNRVQGLGICTLSDHTAYCQSFEALDAHDLGLECNGVSRSVAIHGTKFEYPRFRQRDMSGSMMERAREDR